MRRVTREADDGFDSEVVAGLRSSTDAERLADELAFSEARLAELRDRPPGLYAEVATGDVEEACWLAFQIAFIGPVAGAEGDPFAAIAAARVSWSSGEVPQIAPEDFGPRSGSPTSAAFAAYRAWAMRTGSQQRGLLGDADWEPERRFARTFERLALPGVVRGVRFELLASLGALGVVPLRAGSLGLGTATGDAVVAAAKRVFGIGDAITLERRAMALSRATGVELAGLDLALYNWAHDGEQRTSMGSRAATDADRRAEIASLLGVTVVE